MTKHLTLMTSALALTLLVAPAWADEGDEKDSSTPTAKKATTAETTETSGGFWSYLGWGGSKAPPATGVTAEDMKCDGQADEKARAKELAQTVAKHQAHMRSAQAKIDSGEELTDQEKVAARLATSLSGMNLKALAEAKPSDRDAMLKQAAATHGTAELTDEQWTAAGRAAWWLTLGGGLGTYDAVNYLTSGASDDSDEKPEVSTATVSVQDAPEYSALTSTLIATWDSRNGSNENNKAGKRKGKENWNKYEGDFARLSTNGLRHWLTKVANKPQVIAFTTMIEYMREGKPFAEWDTPAYNFFRDHVAPVSLKDQLPVRDEGKAEQGAE